MRLQVDPSELESLAQGLSGLLADLEHAGDARSITGAAAENPQLQDAIEGLIVRWTSDLQSLQDKLRRLTTNLDGAGVNYAGAEQTISSQIASVAAGDRAGGLEESRRP